MTDNAKPAAVLAISSQVVYGPVGNSAAVPAMEWLGRPVLALPTVFLSHHPGHGAPIRQVIGAEILEAMLTRIAANGWLDQVAAVVTGYFADAAQIAVIARTIAGLKAARSDLLYLCDPILGDDHTGLYVSGDVAAAIRLRLVPLADIIAPNRFELAWLTGREVATPAAAAEAARLIAPLTLATSIPLAPNRLATMLIGAQKAWLVDSARRAQAPHGTGDLLTGLFIAHYLNGRDGKQALGLAMAALEAVLDASDGAVLDLARGLACAADPLRARDIVVQPFPS